MAEDRRVNISDHQVDHVVREVFDRLAGLVLVSGALGRDGVQGVIEMRAGLLDRPRSLRLDLIAHSRDGVLRLGDWAVEANDAAERLRAACAEQFASMPLNEIRLLGCNTAVRPSGRRAIHGLARLFGTRVLGTKAPIAANDFDDGEFRSIALLADQDDIRAWPDVTAQGTTWWFGRLAQVRTTQSAELLGELRWESAAQVLDHWLAAPSPWRWDIREYTRAEFEAVLDLTEPGLAQTSDLLALPDLEIVVRAGDQRGEPRFHRLTVLLDRELVRVYPQGDRGGYLCHARPTRAWAAALSCGQVIRS